MSKPTFLTDAYDLSTLDPRIFKSRFSDEIMLEVWGQRIDHILDGIVWQTEERHNGWLRAISRFKSYFSKSDLVYLPRFARLVEQRMAERSLCQGRDIRLMPIEYGQWVWARDSALYMCEVPAVRADGRTLDPRQASIGQDIYDDLVVVADACMPSIYSMGMSAYRWNGSWSGVLQLGRVDSSYRELPSLHVAAVGGIIEAKLRDEANPELETVLCIGWDSRDTAVDTSISGVDTDPWVAFRVDPVQKILS